MNNPAEGPGVRVWDAPTRLFHWALVLLVTASLVTGKFDSVLGASTLEWHKRFGFAILALLGFRLAWGFAGGTHARFASFLKGPAALLAYARAVAGGGGADSPGHNPLGGWSVVAMLSALAVQVATGLFLTQEDYAFEAPLAKYASRALAEKLAAIHEANFWVIVALVGLHLSAIAYYTIAKRQDLVRAMVTGRKRLPPESAAQDAQGGTLALGALLLALAAGAVWALVTWA